MPEHFAVVWADTMYPPHYHVHVFTSEEEAQDWAIQNPTYISEVVPVTPSE